ncbi:Hypothetical Protein FCC1311_060812 [Hondaea fermentalgiana]|uniref:Uncharacterized protein n=1 Tax=Hondaea fermentalgiana TaxID=2315210 RepID=A0A2R5GNH4_9STRA|nr:Hypothetical Protein FCC1311_060812 [Hondaea fermentalgiana]|eukprot:GBG29861.1 Hypothetical Protein FCC1311_060812 [Hondaea fermentalgiana]
MDHLQILALMWRQQQRWELPSFWLRISSPVLVFSLDGWSALQFFNAIPGLKFIVYWSEWILLVTTMICFWLAFIASRLPLGRKLEARCRMYAMGDLLVMPALLMTCDASRAGVWYLGVPGLGLGAWILLQQQRHASTLVLGSQKERQERYYLQKEVEWVLHVGKEWATDHIRAVTLFRSGAHHTRTWMAAWKILLVIFCETLTAYETELSVCLSILACCAGVVTMVRRTYRSRLAHHLGCVFAWTFFLNAYLSSLSAARVHSALAVVSVQTPLLIALNAGALGIGLFIAPLTAWYADKTFRDPYRSPPARSIALHLCRDETAKAWVAEVHAARATLVKHRFTPAMLYPVHEFYLHCRRLEAMLAQASRKDSIFQYTLHECLEVLYASISANRNRSMFMATSNSDPSRQRLSEPGSLLVQSLHFLKRLLTLRFCSVCGVNWCSLVSSLDLLTQRPRQRTRQCNW